MAKAAKMTFLESRYIASLQRPAGFLIFLFAFETGQEVEVTMTMPYTQDLTQERVIYQNACLSQALGLTTAFYCAPMMAAGWCSSMICRSQCTPCSSRVHKIGNRNCCISPSWGGLSFADHQLKTPDGRLRRVR